MKKLTIIALLMAISFLGKAQIFKPHKNSKTIKKEDFDNFFTENGLTVGTNSSTLTNPLDTSICYMKIIIGVIDGELKTSWVKGFIVHEKTYYSTQWSLSYPIENPIYLMPDRKTIVK